MSLNKLIRLTIKVDVEPENANLKDTLDYLKELKGAERIELADVEIIGDPRAGEKNTRVGLETAFGKDGIDGEPPVTPFLTPASQDEAEPQSQKDNEPVNLLDRIKLR